MNLEYIGKRLAELRGSRSREEVAKAIGVSISAIGMYETAQRMPRDEVKLRIAQYFETPVSEIFFQNEGH